MNTDMEHRRSQNGRFVFVVLCLATLTFHGCPARRYSPGADTMVDGEDVGFELERVLERIEWESSVEWSSDLEAVRKKTRDWSGKPWPEAGTSEELELADITDTVYTAAKERRIESMVNIKTFPETGAAIRYQTYGQRCRGEEPMTANDLSACDERLIIGWYYIWSERNGKPTSNQNHRRAILHRRETVGISEDQND